MKDRVIKEIELLRKKYTSLQHGENYDWVMMPDFSLPDGWDRKQTRLLFLIPATYSHTAPDNFYVDAGLRLKNGSMPQNYSEGAGVPVGGNWGCFSWHAQEWQPSDEINEGDNLVSFVRSINIRLRERN